MACVLNDLFPALLASRSPETPVIQWGRLTTFGRLRQPCEEYRLFSKANLNAKNRGLANATTHLEDYAAAPKRAVEQYQCIFVSPRLSLRTLQVRVGIQIL